MGSRCSDALHGEQVGLGRTAGYVRLAVLDIDVYLGSQAKIGEINTRFHGKTGSFDDLPIIGKLDRIEVDSMAMELPVDGVPGSVANIGMVSVLMENGASRNISIRAAERLSVLELGLDQGNHPFTGCPYRDERLGEIGRHTVGCDTDP